MSGLGSHTRGSSAMAARGLNGTAKRNMSETQTKRAAQAKASESKKTTDAAVARVRAADEAVRTSSRRQATLDHAVADAHNAHNGPIAALHQQIQRLSPNDMEAVRNREQINALRDQMAIHQKAVAAAEKAANDNVAKTRSLQAKADAALKQLDATAKPAGAKPAGAKPAGAKPAGAKSAGAKSAGAKSAGAKPAGAKPAGAKPAGAKSGGAKTPKAPTERALAKLRAQEADVTARYNAAKDAYAASINGNHSEFAAQLYGGANDRHALARQQTRLRAKIAAAEQALQVQQVQQVQQA